MPISGNGSDTAAQTLGPPDGADEREVFNELCAIVDDAIALYKRDGRPLPAPTSGRDFANKMQHVA